MSKNQKIIIAVVAAAVALAAVFFIYQNLHAKEELRELKQAAVKTIEEVNPEDYEREDGETVSTLQEAYTEQVEKADSPEAVEQIMDAFWNELNQIETKEQKLEKRREEGRKEIVGFKLDDYDDDGIKEIEVLQKKYLKILEKAETEKRIKQAVEDFNEAAAEVKTKAEIAAEKAAAKAAEEEAKAAQSSGPAMAATKANALKYVGSDVSALIAAIGNPISKSYAQSCLGAGQDGVLRYQGFTVYTYKEGGKESIQSVE